MDTTVVRPQDLAEIALAASTADAAVVLVRERSSANLRWANNTLTTNGVTAGSTTTVVSFVRGPGGVATGSVTGPATTPEQARGLVEAADVAARAATPAEDAAELVPPGEGNGTGWEDEPGSTGTAAFVEVAPALGEAFGRAAAAGRILYGFVSHEVTTTYLASTTGLRLRHVQPTGHHGCTGKDAALTRSAWVGGATRDFTDVDVLAVDAELERRLGWAERTVALPAGRYDTVLPPTAVADLAIDLYWGAGARVADEGQSVFSRRGGGTRLGEQVARPGVRLLSDPARPGLEASPFAVAPASDNTASVFDNGLPLGRTAWIDDGRLAALVQTRHTAGLTGQPTTPYVDNLVLEVDDATGSTEDLVAGVDRGLLLTCLWYIREVDPQTMLLTGLTRDGVYLVERGEVVGAVNNFRFNESPLDLLHRFSHASATVPSFGREWGDDHFSRTATPALRVPDFLMSSVSQAL